MNKPIFTAPSNTPEYGGGPSPAIGIVTIVIAMALMAVLYSCGHKHGVRDVYLIDSRRYGEIHADQRHKVGDSIYWAGEWAIVVDGMGIEDISAETQLDFTTVGLEYFQFQDKHRTISIHMDADSIWQMEIDSSRWAAR